MSGLPFVKMKTYYPGGITLGNSAYIKLVEASKQQSITLDEVKNLFAYYKDITSKTGEQLGWNYDAAAFPYDLKEKADAGDKWFYLKSNEPRYHVIVVGVGEENIETEDGEEKVQAFIQIVLPEGYEYGDKNKAVEFGKFLGTQLEGELHLFNGRIMYYYKRK